MANLNRKPVVSAPLPPDCSGTVIDGDITVELGDTSLDAFAQIICDKLEEQTVELCAKFDILEESLTEINETLENLDIEIPPGYIVSPCQPCIIVDGVADPYAFVVINPLPMDGQPALIVYNADGVEIPAGTFEIVTEECDERCYGCEPCAQSAMTGGGCCNTPEEQAAIVDLIAGEMN